MYFERVKILLPLLPVEPVTIWQSQSENSINMTQPEYKMRYDGKAYRTKG